jgi:hypothetical protein
MGQHAAHVIQHMLDTYARDLHTVPLATVQQFEDFFACIGIPCSLPGF